ncbi:MAG: carboxypeptidase-like regulatory domain-containing protein [Chitinophagaceae bacterium]
MNKILLLVGLFILAAATRAKAQFETVRDSVVQLYGVVMTADSLMGIPAVSVTIRGQNRGTITNDQGVFSIVVLKGDEVEFSHVTYKPKTISVPHNLAGNQYSVVQLLVEDTVYLPVTIIRPRPSRQQFERDFIKAKVADDNLEVLRKNNDIAARRVLLKSTPSDGEGATAMQFRNIANRASYAGQVAPQNILSPAAWSEFIQSWKRGDYKKGKYK